MGTSTLCDVSLYSRHAKQLNHFHLSCLRRLLHIRWQDKIPDTEVLEQTGLPSIYTMLQKMQVRWAGHVVRMPDSRLPKQLLYGELCRASAQSGDRRRDSKTVSKRPSRIWALSSTPGSHSPWTTHNGTANSPLVPVQPRPDGLQRPK